MCIIAVAVGAAVHLSRTRQTIVDWTGRANVTVTLGDEGYSPSKIYITRGTRDSSINHSHASREEAFVFFSNEIQEHGAENAYRKFSSSVTSVPVDKQHILAHVFGEALYSAQGLLGFQACDLQYMYGCFHELMGRAITEKGLSIVSDVYDMCIRTSEPRPFACLHGIGHGIIASLGYADEKLGMALAACDSIVDSPLVYSCYSGVFMEYNQQSMLGTEYVRKSGADGDMYRPCTSVEDRYRRACMFEQVPWWHRTLYNGDNSERTFSEIGAFCEREGLSPAQVRACFEGIGNITTPAIGYDPERAGFLCDAASKDLLNRTYCRSMAALSLASAVHNKSDAESLCLSLTGSSLEFCLAYAHSEANMTHPLPAPLL